MVLSKFSEETQLLYLINRLNLDFYSHINWSSHIIWGKQKLKHVSLMCRTQWSSFSSVLQHVWVFARANKVYFLTHQAGLFELLFIHWSIFLWIKAFNLICSSYKAIMSPQKIWTKPHNSSVLQSLYELLEDSKW